MIVSALIEQSAWDKGAWCVIAIALLYGIHRAWEWLKPFLERALNAAISLVNSLEVTTRQQAADNQTHAAANQQTAVAVGELQPMLEELHRSVCGPEASSLPQKATA